jgi:hypothetical protein
MPLEMPRQRPVCPCRVWIRRHLPLWCWGTSLDFGVGVLQVVRSIIIIIPHSKGEGFVGAAEPAGTSAQGVSTSLDKGAASRPRIRSRPRARETKRAGTYCPLAN